MDLTMVKPTREDLLQAMPQFGWDVVKTALAIGYSKSYAETRLKWEIKKDLEFCRKVREQKEKLRKSYTPAEWFNDISAHRQKAYDNGDLTNTRGYDEMLAKHIGAYEVDNIQKAGNDVKQLSPGDRAMLQDIAREYRRRKAIECDVTDTVTQRSTLPGIEHVNTITSESEHNHKENVTEVVTSTNDLVGDIDDMLS